jgi:pimeloyl-ACP methyl ester carboxylesterase
MLDDPLERDYPRPIGAEPGGGHGGSGGNGSNGRPVRKDEIELEERGLYIESWLPERRSRRRPLLFVHGELAGSWLWERWLRYFASRGWEGHALNLRNHYWSRTEDPGLLSFETYLGDVVAGIERLGPNPVAIGHGMGGLLVLKAAAERAGVAGIVLVDAELPAELRPPVRPHLVRDVPVAYGRAVIGWDTPPEKLQRENRDLTLDDVLRIQHLLGQKARESGRARADMLAGVAVDPSPLEALPRLVIDSGLDGSAAAVAAERLAGWLGAEHEQYGAHSHYGMVLGTESHRQVAERVRAFLEAHRL